MRRRRGVTNRFNTHLLFYGGCASLRARARVGGDGQLSRLPADALARVACSLPAASVLSLGGVRGWEVSSCPLTCEEEKEHWES